MAVTLSKGGNVSLSKVDPTLKNVKIGLGWDTRSTDGQDFDLDASAFLLTDAGKVRGDNDFIFYNNLKSSDGSVTHTGDNRTGEGEGDDESLIIELNRVPQEVTKIVFVVTIHDATTRRQSFGQVANAFIRLVNNDSNVEAARYDLSEDASTETAMLFGELYRHAGEWKFRAVGQGYAGGLGSVCAQYGINAS
ncbi:TerD family protein [Pantoea eucalypti]|mgnify:FL=1|jgi:tellurium resistance protein TerD|uniref:TerD family protein n=1 Tax=Pantoea TaxID=53335 RepID=UPI0001E57905|nr:MULTISPECIES: TerD family protein [Pantoea]ADO08010.1 Tellurium resistance protein TerD [Pantoea vagans C9-1]MCW0973857.1 TerD family protein [Pantoea sp. JV6]NEG60172.1 chemical-damaging agent resistance protein C [Pantoea agglomerans]NEG87999.1 chemical-damaging agent resistance protein C [Pantoea agglomerans]NEH01003.1 chemical-damaging agent resistance protein C [Pantoea agglomerans]